MICYQLVIYYLLLTKSSLYFLLILERVVMILRGRPRKDNSINYMVGTRLTGDQLAYVKQRAERENITVSAMIRKIVNERKDSSVKK